MKIWSKDDGLRKHQITITSSIRSLDGIRERTIFKTISFSNQRARKLRDSVRQMLKISNLVDLLFFQKKKAVLYNILWESFKRTTHFSGLTESWFPEKCYFYKKKTRRIKFV